MSDTQTIILLFVLFASACQKFCFRDS